MVSVRSTNIFDVDGRSTIAFAGSTSVNFRSTNEFEVSGITVVSAGRTSAFNERGSTVEFARITSVLYGIWSADDFFQKYRCV